jgi:two-component system, LytTR family, sensor kinase
MTDKGEARTGAAGRRGELARRWKSRVERWSIPAKRQPFVGRHPWVCLPGNPVDVFLGFVAGLAVAASAAAGVKLLRMPRTVLSPEGHAMQAALHAATATLPHLRRGLTPETAGRAAPHLLELTQAAAVALTDGNRVLAFVGAGADHHRSGDDAAWVAAGEHHDRARVDTRLACRHPDCPLRVAVVVPLTAPGARAGTLVALYDRPGRLQPEDMRVVQEAASLVSAQVALAVLETQGELLARAELRALHAQISPHFVYNALAAVANSIHQSPDEARELLGEFAEFIRYAFARERPYVTLADELRYVEKYLRLEKARWGDRLTVRVEVAPEVLNVVVPAFSLQPLVENSIRHGLEAHSGGGEVQITGTDLDRDVEIRVIDNGSGMTAERVALALAGTGEGIGLANVNRRLISTFGSGYGLEIGSTPGGGTTVAMTLPKFRAGIRAA